MNFQHGSTLSAFQDSIFKKIENKEQISKVDINTLRNNYWVKIAFWIAPSSTVIRHYCLLDICNKEARYVNRIFIMLLLLSEGIYEKLWVEGYTFWRDIRTPLIRYSFLLHGLGHHGDIPLNKIIREIDVGFYSIAYYDNGVLYPIPIGDLRYGALHEIYGYPKYDSKNIQFDEYHSNPTYIGPCLRNKGSYYIQESCVGFNLHTKKVVRTITIENGVLKENTGICNVPYEFYTGYENKYPNSISVLKDLMVIDRFLSAIKISFESFFTLLFYKAGVLKYLHRKKR